MGEEAGKLRLDLIEGVRAGEFVGAPLQGLVLTRGLFAAIVRSDARFLPSKR